jgi:hypothetical protein
MASRSQRIPPRFDDDFLDWFRARLEAYWAALPQRTPGEVLAGYVQSGVGGSEWQTGTRWLTGLSDEEIAQVERRWGLAFPPDYRLFLQRLHSEDRPTLRASYLGEDQSPQTAEVDGALATAFVEEFDQYMMLEEGAGFYNWLTNGNALEAQWAWLWEGLQFDVEHAGLWRPSWGPQPNTLAARQARVRELVEGAPRLIPVFGHRYLLAEPCAADNPVFSVWQSDILVYAANLRDYFLFEFSGPLGLERASTNPLYRASNRELERATHARVHERFPGYQAIPFWGEFLTH